METNSAVKCEMNTSKTVNHSSEFSYCSECDLILCSNCIISHYAASKPNTHNKKNSIISLMTHFSLFIQNVNLLEKQLDTLNDIEGKYSKLLQPMRNNMQTIQDIQKELSNMYESYESTVKSIENEMQGRPKLSEKDYKEIKGQLSELKNIYSNGNYEVKKMLKSLFDVNKRIESYEEEKKILKSGNQKKIINEERDIEKNLNLVIDIVTDTVNISSHKKKEKKLDKENAFAIHKKENRRINYQSVPFMKNDYDNRPIKKEMFPIKKEKDIELLYPYHTENLIYINKAKVKIYNSKYQEIFETKLTESNCHNCYETFTQLDGMKYINIIDGAFIIKYKLGLTEYTKPSVFLLKVNKFELSLYYPANLYQFTGDTIDITTLPKILGDKWYSFNIAYCSKTNIIYVICYESECCCQYLDLNNLSLGWKIVSSPNINSTHSVMCMLNQRYLLLFEQYWEHTNKKIGFEMYDTTNLKTIWEQYELDYSVFNPYGMGILYIDESSLILLCDKDTKSNHRVEFDNDGKTLSSVQNLQNCNDECVFFPCGLFFKCGNELVNWDDSDGNGKLIVFDEKSQKLKISSVMKNPVKQC